MSVKHMSKYCKTLHPISDKNLYSLLLEIKDTYKNKILLIGIVESAGHK